LKNIRVAFKPLEDHENSPIGYTEIDCHMVFDVKMDYTRTFGLVAGGHVTDPIDVSPYSSAVSRESVRVALIVAALNDLELEAGYIQNAYLTAKCEENIFTTCGPEFGPDPKGRRAIIVRALYGLRTSGKAFMNHL